MEGTSGLTGYFPNGSPLTRDSVRDTRFFSVLLKISQGVDLEGGCRGCTHIPP